jgi:flagellar protein FlaF
MQAAAKSYRSVARKIASPRELEANLLLDAASRLQTVADVWELDRSGLVDALTNNRKLWMVFLLSATDETNTFPIEFRENVANLGLFIMKHTFSVMANPQRDALGPLININRTLAAGLRNNV